jgi:hypothetical protein
VDWPTTPGAHCSTVAAERQAGADREEG